MAKANSSKSIVPAPRSRGDLSFTARDEAGGLENWVVPIHSQYYNWEEARQVGQSYFGEVKALAAFSEREAFQAIAFAMNGSAWSNRGGGWEMGFAEALAATAIVGLRALREGAVAYDPDAPSAAEEKMRRKRIRAATGEADRKRTKAARRDPAFQRFMQKLDGEAPHG